MTTKLLGAGKFGNHASLPNVKFLNYRKVGLEYLPLTN
jgi:hypothetical protein